MRKQQLQTGWAHRETCTVCFVLARDMGTCWRTDEFLTAFMDRDKLFKLFLMWEAESTCRCLLSRGQWEKRNVWSGDKEDWRKSQTSKSSSSKTATHFLTKTLTSGHEPPPPTPVFWICSRVSQALAAWHVSLWPTFLTGWVSVGAQRPQPQVPQPPPRRPKWKCMEMYSLTHPLALVDFFYPKPHIQKNSELTSQH